MRLRLRPQDRFLWRVILGSLALVVLILLVGCVTVSDCRAYVRGMAIVECDFQ